MGDTGTSATPATAADPTFDPAPPSAEATTTPPAPAADDVLGDDVLADDASTVAATRIDGATAPVARGAGCPRNQSVRGSGVEQAAASRSRAAVDAFESIETFETFDASSSVDEPADSFVDETSGTLADVS